MPSSWIDSLAAGTLPPRLFDAIKVPKHGVLTDYRNDSGAMTSLNEDLNRLRENAVQLARSDARDVISRFGQMGTRRLAAVGLA